jgi:HAD superfamily hydrolase (TIGR01509 family)
MTPIKAIFFDVGNTLLFRHQDTILAGLHHNGIYPTPSQLHAIERRTKREFDDSVMRGGDVDHGFWWAYYSHLLEELNLHDDSLRDALVTATRISANWCDILPGTREVLQRLGSRYRLAVISNADGKIADVLKACGIADCFATITDSGIVGYEKPHPAIFQAAMKALSADAGESLYVGDVYSVDYFGATRAGMQAVLFDVCGAYRDTAWPRVESMQELETRLETA